MTLKLHCKLTLKLQCEPSSAERHSATTPAPTAVVFRTRE